MITITIPFRTPTINHLYWHRGNIKILTKEARELREKIRDICYDTLKENLYLLDGKKLRVIVEVYENWYTKKGEVKKKDISNREKFLIDSIFKGAEWDDKFIWDHRMIKVQSDKEKTIIKIDVINGKENTKVLK